MTPFIAKYEFTRLKVRICTYMQALKDKWFIQIYADKQVFEQYEKGLFENVENTPQLVFEAQAGYTPISYEKHEVFKFERMEETSNDSILENKLTTECIDQQEGQLETQEEIEIMEFLTINKAIDELRMRSCFEPSLR